MVKDKAKGIIEILMAGIFIGFLIGFSNTLFSILFGAAYLSRTVPSVLLLLNTSTNRCVLITTIAFLILNFSFSIARKFNGITMACSNKTISRLLSLLLALIFTYFLLGHRFRIEQFLTIFFFPRMVQTLRLVDLAVLSALPIFLILLNWALGKVDYPIIARSLTRLIKSRVVKVSSLVILFLMLILNIFGYTIQHSSREDDSYLIELRPEPYFNIVLITIDTLRADHVSCYGYERETTPFIDSITAQGTLFSNAYATSPWTSPSMASIFTSLYPRSHGVLHGGISKEEIVDQELLSQDFTTIAEVLKSHGYATFGVSTNGHMSTELGFARGFDHFTCLWFKDCPAPNDAVEAWKNEIQEASRYFLWVHYLDPHAPYTAKEPWISSYNPNKSSYEPWDSVHMGELRKRESELIKDPKAIKALRDLYDSGINNTDEFLRNLFEDLSLMDNSLVIITADHGEGFLDHENLIGHGNSLFEELIRVPLIVALPDQEPVERIVDRPVSIIDIYPTILDVAGIPITRGIQGESFIPLMKGLESMKPRAIYAELERGKNMRAVRLGDWKYIWSAPRKRECYLYNLVADPGERYNLVSEKADVAADMRAIMDEWVATHPPFEAPRTSKIMERAKRELLRSLGYLD